LSPIMDKIENSGHHVPIMGQFLDFEALADFVATVDAGGITAGAHRRGQPKQTVSRRIMALEAALGVRLFDRSNRALRLTPEGVLLLERARRLLADLEETRQTLSDRSGSAAGLLRISAPVLLGQTLLGAVAARMLAAHPDLLLEIVLSDRRVDLVEDGFDAAIRVGPQDDSSLIHRVFATAETIIVAAPSAIAAYGAPAHPSELAHRPCILFGERISRSEWVLSRDDERVEVKVNGRLSSTSLKFNLDAAAAGAGFASVPAYIARPMIEARVVERALPAWHSARVPLRIVYPSKRLPSARLRVFLDGVVANFSAVVF
jgi:LysR family transcriptional regulator, regulator for bpeEF and oprC